MVTQVLKCERHGESTRITCVECGTPICPKCLVRTEVGLKCETCARPAPAQVAAQTAAERGSRLPLLVGAGGLALIAVVVLALAVRMSQSDPPAPPAAPPIGRWLQAPGLATIRGTTSAVVLKDGRVLVAGGGVGAIPLGATELFDPASGAWVATAPLSQARRGHQAVLLGDGRVLVAGGFAEGELLASAEIYDPGRGTWSTAMPMSAGRLGHSLTLLNDGRVLAAGGTARGAGEAAGGQTIRPDASAEVFDPVAGRWSPVASMGVPRFEHTATFLNDGRVLMVGGLGPVDGGKVGPLVSTELYDPAANAFVRSTNQGEGRANHSAALLPDGSVLVSGGAGGANGDVSIGSAEVFDPRQGSWTGVAPLREARTGQTSTALADGRVLVAGGESAIRGARRSLVSAEVFDPRSRSWRSAGSMTCPRSEQSAAILRDGSVLVVAGDATFPGQAPIAQSCAERYQP